MQAWSRVPKGAHGEDERAGQLRARIKMNEWQGDPYRFLCLLEECKRYAANTGSHD